MSSSGFSTPEHPYPPRLSGGDGTPSHSQPQSGFSTPLTPLEGPPPPTMSSTPFSTDRTYLTAVQTLFHDPERGNKKRANEWLSEFQHSSEAWEICHAMLTSQDNNVTIEPRLIAAQTLRTKIIYDLSQLPPTALAPLRDSLLTSVDVYTAANAPTGSRAVVIQLCLSLADLAYQMDESQWPSVVQNMIDQFGSKPEKVSMLIEFLKALVEEGSNARIPISSQQAHQRAEELLTSQTERVMSLLSMYFQAQGVSASIQAAVFATLRAWLQAGEIDAGSVAQTPLFDFAFKALSSDQLFDEAVDVVCSLIHETQEVEDNVEVIQQIVPRVLAILPLFEEARHDEVDDRVRGFCRVFTEAGETYRQLVLQHPETFLPLVQAIGACAAYPDLDIVPITFNFWYKLAQTLGKRAEDEQSPFINVYSGLFDSMIRHLQFPTEEQTPEARDEFRQFRHIMGDTLKDCCQVLGAGPCMKRAYELVQKGGSWQEVEAPLFSMRSMGAEVDPQDDEILPHVMDLLPKLPVHPKIQYAATLVISRYTMWIAAHSEYLSYSLNYISSGFESKDPDVSAAAAQAMKFMCQDCRDHLVPYLDQLYAFITTAGAKLPVEDRLEIAEAIGWVIGSMPQETAAQAIVRFVQPAMEVIQKGGSTKEDVNEVIDSLEIIDAYLTNVPPIGGCDPTPYYDVMDALLDSLVKLVPRVTARMIQGFEGGGHSAFLWILGKIVGTFGGDVGSLDRVTSQVMALETSQGAREIPDVLDDYVQFINQHLAMASAALIECRYLSGVVSMILATCTLPSPESVMSGLETLDDILRLCLTDPRASSALLPILDGQSIVTLVLHGLLRDFPEDAVMPVGDIMKDLTTLAPPEKCKEWVTTAMASVAASLLPQSAKDDFIGNYERAFKEANLDQVKNAIRLYFRSVRKARDRKDRMSRGLDFGLEER